MRKLRACFVRLRGMFDKERRDRDLAEEIETHLQDHVRHNLQCGMTAEQARRDAVIRFGGVEAAKESYREQRGVPFLEHRIQDLSYALHSARKNPGFTAVIVLTLALGIGVNALVFSVVHALFLRPLPFQDAARLAIVHKQAPPDGGKGLVSYSGLQELRKRGHVFEAAAGCEYTAWPGVLRSGESIELASVVGITEDFLPLLGVRPFLGNEFRPGEQAAVILSHRMWRSVFNGRPDIIGRQVQLDGSSRTVAGVMPADFQLFRSERPELFIPSSAARHPEVDLLEAVVRLRRGVTRPQAERELADASRASAPGGSGRPAYRVIDLRSRLFGSYRGELVTLAGAVIFVLLIACANVANLLFARMTVRTQELRIRVALGASRFRVTSQLLTENLVMAVLGGALGLVLALWGLRWIDALRIGGSRSLPPFAIDLPVLGFVALVCLIIPLLCALAPALRFCAPLGSSHLREAAPQITPTHWRIGRLIVVSGMAFSFMLLLGAGLLVSSFLRVARVDPGFETENMLFMDFDDNQMFYTDLERRQSFYDSLVRHLQATPGIKAAGMTDQVPLSDDVMTVAMPITLTQDSPLTSRNLSVFLRSVDSGFFQAMGIPVKRGRLFAERDNLGSLPAAIINESFARRTWGNRDPVGQRLRAYGRELTIVGVVGDIRELGLRVKPAEQVLYVSARQFMKGNRVLVVRTAADPLAMVSAIKSTARGIESSVPAIRARSMARIVSDSIGVERFGALLMSGLGLLALVLACVGVYALVAFSVSQRTREFAVRIALGAQHQQILRLLLKEGSPLIGAAVGLGAIGGWILSRFLAGQLYGVSADDPLFFVAAAVSLAAFASVACYVPARRASRTDPVSALRYE